MLQNLYFDILMIEDCETDAELSRMAIEGVDEELRIHHIWDGEDAIKWLKNAPFRPKMILLDIKMPKVSGIEVMEEIRKHKLLSDVPVVIATSSLIPSDEQRCKELGVEAFVTKPLDLYGYLETVGLAVSSALDLEFTPVLSSAS